MHERPVDRAVGAADARRVVAPDAVILDEIGAGEKVEVERHASSPLGEGGFCIVRLAGQRNRGVEEAGSVPEERARRGNLLPPPVERGYIDQIQGTASGPNGPSACRPGFQPGKDVTGGGEVLDDAAERLVDRDVGGIAAARQRAGHDLADLAEDMVVADQAGRLRAEEFGALGEHALAMVGEEAGADDQVVGDLGRAGAARADRVDVGAVGDPFAARIGSGAAVVVQMMSAPSTAASTLGAASAARPTAQTRAANASAWSGERPQMVDLLERPHDADRLDMPPGLLAIAEDGEARGVGPGERVGGGGRGGGGADGGDLAGLEDRRRRAGLGIEQDDDALVRAAAFGEIARDRR